MTQYYAIRDVDCTPEQIERIYNLFESSMDADSSGYHPYQSNSWEFIVFEESVEIYQCTEEHLIIIEAELITPEEAIQRLFEIYLEK